jgi:hypothetical protein
MLAAAWAIGEAYGRASLQAPNVSNSSHPNKSIDKTKQNESPDPKK